MCYEIMKSLVFYFLKTRIKRKLSITSNKDNALIYFVPLGGLLRNT